VWAIFVSALLHSIHMFTWHVYGFSASVILFAPVLWIHKWKGKLTYWQYFKNCSYRMFL